MSSITVNITDERYQKLQELARHFKVAPEDLVRVSVEELLARPEDSFKQTVEYVMKKNAELYKRLA
ncbi:MAG: DNA-binding protein [Ignavibacteriae bacterium]|nr:DNA-binding protein [Ignavibacteriota bacterium]